MPVRLYLKRRFQDLMMFFEGLLRLILYFGPQRAVEHDYEEGRFQQEPIISLMVEPCCFYPIWKTGTDKKYQILKKTSNQQFEQFLTIYLHDPTVFFNLFKNSSKVTRYLTICATQNKWLKIWILEVLAKYGSFRSPKDSCGGTIQRDLIKC